MQSFDEDETARQDDCELIAAAAITAVDINAPAQSLPRWKQAELLYEAARIAVSEVLPGDPSWSTLQNLDAPQSRALYRTAVMSLELSKANGNGKTRELAERVREGARLIYFTSPFTFSIQTATKDRVVSGPQIRVVVPFRDDSTRQSRFQNLITLVERLNQQTLRKQIRIVVVEGDISERHEYLLSCLVDEYVYVQHSGPFNKSMLVNRGVASSNGDEDILILDGDLYLPDNFIELIVHARQEKGRNFVPGNRGLFLDSKSSDDLRNHDTPDAAIELSGYALADPRGLCVATNVRDFRAIGGFDESFIGWGGEDRDFHMRLNAARRVGRLRGDLFHLAHQRPDMNPYTESLA
ncbi:galactosyltransferase-related protein [Paenarthrobacter sp. RAF54_2]|uniref:galactosyltransferase-related protein n=1 Tax=unclassified Paenarthrobacter TaxID=2634190 RepID=UPI003F959D71